MDNLLTCLSPCTTLIAFYSDMIQFQWTVNFNICKKNHRRLIYTEVQFSMSFPSKPTSEQKSEDFAAIKTTSYSYSYALHTKPPHQVLSKKKLIGVEIEKFSCSRWNVGGFFTGKKSWCLTLDGQRLDPRNVSNKLQNFLKI